MRSRSLSPLPLDFFRRSAETVARELVGQVLVRELDSGRLAVRIVETEAYLGAVDRASHAWNGRRTERTAALFRDGGVAYVYLIYGLHHLFNVVTGGRADGSAVLVRAGEPLEGLAVMERNRSLPAGASAGSVAGGPGRLTQAMGIDLALNGVSLNGAPLSICRGIELDDAAIARGVRIGVDYAAEAARWPLRFAERFNPHVSRPHPWRRGSPPQSSAM